MNYSSSVTVPRLAELSLDQKIAQLFSFAVFPQNFDISKPNRVSRFIEKYGLGSIHLAYGNVAQTRRVRSFLDALSIEACGIPILFGADFEQGLPHSFDGGTELPWQMALGATQNPSWAEAAGKIVGKEAAALGIQMIYGPVADVTSNPENRMLISRSFGQDSDQVAEWVSHYVQGIQSTGILATLKHFPGHGHAVEDSHVALPEDGSDLQFIRNHHLKPFIAGIKAGAGAIMTGHVVMKALDPHVPATLSYKVLTELLRKELQFEGLIITDSLNMHAICKCLDQPRTVSALRALQAGADIVLHPKSLEAAWKEIKRAVETGQLPEETVDRSVERILKVKREVIQRRSHSPLNGLDAHYLDAHQQSALKMANAAVTLVSGMAEYEQIVNDLKSGSMINIVEVVDDMDRGIALDRVFSHIISQHGNDAKTYLIKEKTPESELNNIYRSLTTSSGEVILAVYCPMMWFKGRTLLADSFTQKLKFPLKSVDVKMTVVFGSPYILEKLPGKVKICGYGPDKFSQIAAAKVVLGEQQPKGRLPVVLGEKLQWK